MLLEYDASRWIVEPFHLFDCCMENDGAAALILGCTNARRPSRKSRYLLGAARDPAPVGASHTTLAEYASGNFRHGRARLYRMVGVEPKDIGVVQAYDSFTGAY